MKKRLAAFAATGALTLGALAGSVGSASAQTVHPDGGGRICSYSLNECFDFEGAFANSQSCVDYVAQIGNPPGWDCEYYSNPWFDYSDGVGWYATSVYFPKTP